MILRFPYLAETLHGAPPPSLPKTARVRWRPFLPITVHGPRGASFMITRAVLDSGADDTILPFDLAALLGVAFLPGARHGLTWRGQHYAMQFGEVQMELTDDAGATLRWPATVAFSRANLRYPLLGVCGFLEYFNVTFLGDDRALEITPNAAFPTGAP